jgi:hypothetical protein
LTAADDLHHAIAGDLRVSQRAREVIAEVSTGLFIDGEWRVAASGDRFDVVSPATRRSSGLWLTVVTW